MSSKNLALPRYGQRQPHVDATGGPNVRALAFGEWRTRGSCRGQQQDLWFAAPGSRDAARALLICQACPVRRECLAAALVFGDRFGVWGGVDDKQRRQLTRDLHRGATLGGILDRVLGPGQAGAA